MRKVLFDQVGNKTTWAHLHDDPGGSVTLEEVEDVDPLLAFRQAVEDTQPARHDGLRPEAVIPQTVLARAFREGWYHDQEAWRRWANDPDNQAFRIRHGGRVKRL